MLRIGKNLTNDLVIKDRAAEDFHCILYLSKGDLVVEDLKSHYGTLVNGTRITHAILYPGDELQIGFTRIEWQKLMPALQAIGDNSDAESFLQMQDLNLEVRDEELKPEQNQDESISIGDYTIDSTNELLDKARLELSIRELDYSVSVNAPSEDVTIDSTQPSTENTDSNSTEVLDSKPEAGKIELPKAETSSIGKNQTKNKNPYKVYYFTLIAMLALMILSGLLIVWITG
jgi:pSer/pThr/pTyr-binding forkhead associated (FHA) protein